MRQDAIEGINIQNRVKFEIWETYSITTSYQWHQFICIVFGYNQFSAHGKSSSEGSGVERPSLSKWEAAHQLPGNWLVKGSKIETTK